MTNQSSRMERLWASMTADDRRNLKDRFAIYCANGNDNRTAHITVQEAELLIYLAGTGSED